MARASYGDDVKARVKRLFEALLAYVNDEVEEGDKISIEYTRQSETQLVIRTKRRDLETLMAKYKYEGKLTQAQVREALNRLEDFLGILQDHRTSPQGSEDWHFTLKLWHTHKDKEKNLKQFDIEWEKRRSPKSKEYAQKTATPVQETRTPYNNLGRRGILEVNQFVGREKDLEDLHELFVNNTEVVIAGMGGVGKTELVLQYARKHLLDYQGGVFWSQAKDWTVKLIEFARVHIPNFYLPEQLTLEGQLASCWRQWVEGEVLLILDDVSEYKQQVKPYLPEDPRFKILITTRQRFGNKVLPLNVLSAEAALKLLKVLVGTERVDSQLKQAEELCQWLEYLPLGLELVGRYLVQDGYLHLSLEDMLSQLREKKRLKHRALKNAGEKMTAELGVEAAFDLSWERLDKKTQELGCLLSLFALAPIPWSLVESMATEEEKDDWEDARDNLSRLYLIKFVEKETYSLHQLIREFFISKQNNLASSEERKKKFCQVIANKASTIEYVLTLETVQELNPFIPHLAETAKTLLEWVKDEDVLWIFTGLGKNLYI